MFKGSSKLGLYGIIATIAYFLGIAYLIFFSDFVEPKALTLNELGDFFAGVFGPPALIWVVISFYLQSEELKNSVSALRLQAEELAKSVEQQIAMVDLTRESISHEKEKFGLEEEVRKANLLPNFSIEKREPFRITMGINIVGLRIRNIGSPTTETKIDLGSNIKPSGLFNFPNVWDRSDQYDFDVVFKASSLGMSKQILKISFKDTEGNCGQQEISVSEY